MQSLFRSLAQRQILNPSLISRFKTLNPSATGWGNHQTLGLLRIRSVSTDVARGSVPVSGGAPPPKIKFKRLDKTARHLMQILDKEAVEEVKGARELPDIRPGYIVQMEVPENKRRTTVIKGTVIARRNAGLNTTFRIRRLVAGVGIESLFPLY